MYSTESNKDMQITIGSRTWRRRDMGIISTLLAFVREIHLKTASNMELLCLPVLTWWRHKKETFSALLAICAGNPPVTGEFPAQRPVTRSFDVFFDLPLNKRLSKQWWGWWFETPLRPLWRHCNEFEQGLDYAGQFRWSETQWSSFDVTVIDS